MAVKIRLRRQGRRNRPFYRLVATDGRARRDGKYLENLGWYNPIESEDEKNAFVRAERVQHWISMGAQLTEKAHALVKRRAPEALDRKSSS